MSAEGSVERIALNIGRLLEPLTQRLGTGDVRMLLAELGLQLPPELTNRQAFVSALGSAGSAVQEIPPHAAQLSTAIQNDDLPDILQHGVALVNAVGNVLSSLDTISLELNAASGALPGVNPADVVALANELPPKLFDYLVVRYLEGNHPVALQTLALAGIIDFEPVQGTPGDASNPAFFARKLGLERIGEMLESPEDLLKSLYGWGDPAFDGRKLMLRLAELLRVVGVAGGVVPAAPNAPVVIETMPLRIAPRTDVNPKGAEIVLHGTLPGGYTVRRALPIAGWSVEITIDMELKAETGVLLQPPAKVTFIPPSDSAQGRIEIMLVGEPVAPADHVPILNVAGGTGVDSEEIRLGAVAELRWDSASGRALADLGVKGGLRGGRLRIGMDDADGFLAKILSGLSIEATFDLGLMWTAGGGISFTGSSALEVQLPIHVSLGPVEFETATFSIGIDGNTFPIGLAVDIKATLGPLKAVVEQIGAVVDLSLPADHEGMLGPFDLGFSFKPPKGVGLSIDAGVVAGGGYLYIDVDRGEYAGALELTISEVIAVKAFGLITTKMPDGSDGFSLIIIMTAEFGTGIQLGYGFTLLAVGGLIGLNRRMKLDALMEGVRTGAINSIMFPQDVVANAPKIISDIRTLFPPQEGTLLIGPMAKLGWGTPTLISLSLAVIIEIPGNIAIVGVLKIALPTEDLALLILQVNFAGAIEFDKKRGYFFAALFQSRVLFATIEGEMGLLIAVGGDAAFVVSVGGCHPRFSPPPLPFPSPRRIAISLIDTSVARVRVEGYFAVTSNTVQFGALAELFFGLDSLNVSGHLSFDALFQFSPFFFIIEISASFSVKVFGIGLFSVSLRGSLEGPTPWRAQGEASISLLFFDISVDVDVTWGDSKDTSLPPIEVMPLLKAELGKEESWTALLPSGTHLLVSLRALAPSEAGTVLHPVGVLRVTQRKLPLELTLTKVGNQKPSDVSKLSLAFNGAGMAKVGDAYEMFAPAQFKQLSDAEKLSSPAYGPERAGLDLSASGQQVQSSKMVRRIVRYEEIIIDSNYKRFVRKFAGYFGTLFSFFLKGSSVTKCELSKYKQKQLKPFDETIVVTPETFSVAFMETNTAFSGVFASEASAREFMLGEIAKDPSLGEQLHVIPTFEMAAV